MARGQGTSEREDVQKKGCVIMPESSDYPDKEPEQFILDAGGFRVAEQILDAFPDVPLPDDFGPYHFERWIGRGGMGQVFLANDSVADRRVAIKFLLHTWAEPDLRRQFAREIRTLA